MHCLAEIVLNHDDLLTLPVFLGAYSRACSGGYMLNAEDAMDPAMADLRGDGGEELLHDLRAANIGVYACGGGGSGVGEVCVSCISPWVPFVTA